MERSCSIEGCTKPFYGHDWCEAHYRRWYRNGDPLARKPRIEGKCRHYYREVVLTYEGDECLTWPYNRISSGYAYLYYEGCAQLVSRLVCEETNGPPPTPEHEAAHSCGKGHLGCVTKGHLSWKTPTENAADKFTHGTHPSGERNGAAKLTMADVHDILSLKGSASQRKLADRFGVSQAAISNIHTGKQWSTLRRAG